MKHLPRNCVALTFLAASATLAANAADAESSWALGERNGQSFLHMTDASGPSLSLRCHDKLGLQAVLYLDGNGIDELDMPIKTKVKTRNVHLDTDSTDRRDGSWLYVRANKTLYSAKGWQAKRIYNAAISGSTVDVDITRVGSYNLTPPPVNDAFKSFVSSCDSI
ncbi:MAG: hypothetical protein VXW22_11285 [Pseudomonadota bacterium]|nr:hypothetical protein [Pseudomonadota bacterium]